jgi:pimeloyl-ACP methyl ester carboxylesterase
VLVTALGTLLLPGVAAGAPGGALPATLQLGSQTLKLCGSSPTAYCGSLSVALDHAVPGGPQIPIAYRWYPAQQSGPAARTVVPVEGGPGYPSIESVAYHSQGHNAGYSTMYGPLLARWNLLAVDNRGTGESSALNCPALQSFSGPTRTAAFQQAAAGCAQKLNRRWRYPDGESVQASDLFSSAPAAEDLAAVIKALELPKVDLYGDSYGSFFAQVFAARFPRLVRSVVLDSTYPASGLDPWYRSTEQSMPGAFDAACVRSQACSSAELGTAWARISALAERLRAAPIAGRVPGSTGALQAVSMNIVGLVDLVSDAAEDTRIYGALDAAARALLSSGDPAPLLRLYAQREHEDEGYFHSPVREYSVELYLADACIDYPQLFDMGAPGATRASELAAAEAALGAGTFTPFSAAEWISQNENTEAFSACIGWPSPGPAAQPPTLGAPPLLPASLPVLVLGGEFDTWTPPVDAPKVLAEIGGHARFIELANSTHVVGEGDTECGSSLIQRFVAQPQQLDSLDEACAPAVAPIHSVGVFATNLAEQPPLQPAAGNAAETQELRLAAAAVQSAGDALSRYEATEAKTDHGLRGGSVTATRDGALLTLAADRLVPGVAVSGTVKTTPSPIAANGDSVVASLTARAAGLPPLSLTASWTASGDAALAQVAGVAAGRALEGSMPAP